MTHNDPKYSHYDPYDPKLGKLFYNDQKESIKTFHFFFRLYFFGGNFGPKLENFLFKMKLDTEGYSRLPILNSTIIFLNFVPNIFFGQIWS